MEVFSDYNTGFNSGKFHFGSMQQPPQPMNYNNYNENNINGNNNIFNINNKNSTFEKVSKRKREDEEMEEADEISFKHLNKRPYIKLQAKRTNNNNNSKSNKYVQSVPIVHEEEEEAMFFPNSPISSISIEEIDENGEKISNSNSNSISETNSTPNSNQQIILYQHPSIKIPKGIDASKLWNRIVLMDNDGVIHLLNKMTGEEQIINMNDLQGGELIPKELNPNGSYKSSVIINQSPEKQRKTKTKSIFENIGVHSDSDSDVESNTPRVVEITDEEEQEILRKQNQKKVEQLESELEEMDLD